MKDPEQHRDPQLATSGDPIGFYEREFYPLSNFSSFMVEWRGRLWITSEHAYQAAHFLDDHPAIADEIAHARSAHEAFKLAKETYREYVPTDWHERKAAIMEDVCRHKRD